MGEIEIKTIKEILDELKDDTIEQNKEELISQLEECEKKIKKITDSEKMSEFNKEFEIKKEKILNSITNLQKQQSSEQEGAGGAAPPPPPPPPLPGKSGGPGAPPPPPPLPATSPSSPKGPMSAGGMAAALAAGASKLNKVEAAPKKVDDKTDLMSAIRQGITLKKASDRVLNDAPKSNAPSSIAQILDRRIAIADSDDEEDEEDDVWSD